MKLKNFQLFAIFNYKKIYLSLITSFEKWKSPVEILFFPFLSNFLLSPFIHFFIFFFYWRTTASGYVVPETQGYFLDEFETEDPPVLSQRTVKTAEDECEREEKDVETITDDDDDDEAEEGDNEEGKNDDDDDEDFEEEDRLRFKKKFDKGKGKGKENLKPAQKHRGV